MTDTKNKLFRLATTGVLSYIIADVVHEVIGHAGTCLIIGNKIQLLTSAYFNSTPGNVFVDMGGPVANLIAGMLGLLLISGTKMPKLLLLQVTAFNLFWFAGTVLQSAISNTGDWTYAVEHITSGTAAKLILIVAGVSFYVLFMRLFNSYLADTGEKKSGHSLTRQDIIYSFLFAAAAAFIAGLFFGQDRILSAFECLLEMAASLPILVLRVNNKPGIPYYKNENNYFFNISVCVVFVVFCLTLGKGIAF